MKKLFGFLKGKKEDETLEEVKATARYDEDQVGQTKDKDSTSDDQSKEVRLEDIKRSMLDRKIKKFDNILGQQMIDLEKLRALGWNGIPQMPASFRCTCWKLLLDYMPVDMEMQGEIVNRKREEYTDMIEHYFGSISFESVSELLQKKNMSAYEKKSMKQIKIDVYRTQPETKLFSTTQI